MLSVVVIPYDDAIPLKLETIEIALSSSSIEREIEHFLTDDNYENDDGIDTRTAFCDTILSTLLIRSRPKQRQGRRSFHTLLDHDHCRTVDDNSSTTDHPPLYAYHIPKSSSSSSTDQQPQQQLHPHVPNIRATRFAMACGHWSIRFYGTVVLATTTTTTTMATTNHPYRITEAMFREIQIVACHCGPDLRHSIIRSLLHNNDLDTDTSSTKTTTSIDSTSSCNRRILMITAWIGNAAQEQYHDRAIVQQFQNLFAGTEPNHHHKDDTDSDSEKDETTTVNEENDECDVVVVVKSQHSQHETNGTELHEAVNTHQIVTPMPTTTTIQPPPQESSSNSNLLLRRPARNCDDTDMTAAPFVPNDIISSFFTTTFCYTCRRPATTLCSQCHGVYFCHDTCQTNGYGTKKV